MYDGGRLNYHLLDRQWINQFWQSWQIIMDVRLWLLVKMEFMVCAWGDVCLDWVQ